MYDIGPGAAADLGLRRVQFRPAVVIAPPPCVPANLPPPQRWPPPPAVPANLARANCLGGGVGMFPFIMACNYSRNKFTFMLL